MAASKDTRRCAPDTNPIFLKLFRNSSVSKERECIWHDAAHHAGAGDPPLRFPVYEHLYLLNVYTQKMVEPLENQSRKFAINSQSLPYLQSVLQYVRAAASHGQIDFMARVEETEAGFHLSQQRVEEEKLRDPDNIHVTVGQREVERRRQKLPPRIRFLGEHRTAKASTVKERRPGDGD
jgi:hypothetical protein